MTSGADGLPPEREEPTCCPRCRAELGLTDLFTGGRHAMVGECPACGGRWMRRSDLDRLSKVVEPVLTEWRPLARRHDQDAPLDCPECTPPRPMRKLGSERDRRVVLDACAHCGGVWLDPNELEAIQQEAVLALLVGFLRAPSVT